MYSKEAIFSVTSTERENEELMKGLWTRLRSIPPGSEQHWLQMRDCLPGFGGG
jgi:hypothetical protein